MPGMSNDPGNIELVDAETPHRELLGAFDKSASILNRILASLTNVGEAIIRIDAGGTMSDHTQLRVRRIVFSAGMAGAATLTVGEGVYPFTLPAFPVEITFPLVIGRGINIGYAGAAGGTCYLICDTE